MSLLALDVGGTKLAAACGERSERIATPGEGGDALQALLALAQAVADDTPVTGVGVSFGGHVDSATGSITRSLHVAGWEDVPLATLLRERFHAPALVENDANAGALGEWDEARRPSSLCYVTVSTGVGAGIVVDGELWRGHDGLAGEVGHLVVEPDGEQCACGRRGCVETIASGPAIARRGGDDRALADAGRALSVAVAALIAIVNPALVVVGGGVSAAGPSLWNPLLAQVERLTWPDVTTQVRAAATQDSSLNGARVLAGRAAAAA